jgi:hypothetical protein
MMLPWPVAAEPSPASAPAPPSIPPAPAPDDQMQEAMEAGDGPVVFVLPQDVDAEAATAALRTIRAHTADVEAEFIIERPE